jgi:hypothetical protein
MRHGDGARAAFRTLLSVTAVLSLRDSENGSRVAGSGGDAFKRREDGFKGRWDGLERLEYGFEKHLYVVQNAREPLPTSPLVKFDQPGLFPE